jgi:hypothetical protein
MRNQRKQVVLPFQKTDAVRIKPYKKRDLAFNFYSFVEEQKEEQKEEEKRDIVIEGIQSNDAVQKFSFEILISPECNGENIKIEQFPDLKIEYISSRSGICHPHVCCCWGGDIELVLKVNDKEISLHDHDEQNHKLFRVPGEGNISYLLQGGQSLYQNPMYMKFSVLRQDFSGAEQKNIDDVFDVKLAFDATTGYQWSLLDIDNLDAKGHSYEKLDDTNGNFVYSFKGSQKGPALAIAKYSRGWAPSDEERVEYTQFLIV